MKTLTLNVPAPIAEALQREADQELISRAAVVRRVLLNHVRQADAGRFLHVAESRTELITDGTND